MLRRRRLGLPLVSCSSTTLFLSPTPLPAISDNQQNPRYPTPVAVAAPVEDDDMYQEPYKQIIRPHNQVRRWA